MAEYVPTILIGLGGIGSKVVNDIYGKIPENRRSSVAIHAFDTDVNDINRLKHIGDHVTQTSTKMSVSEYMEENEQVKKWFPDSQFVINKPLTDGAGQVRAVSRLAFRAAMQEGKLTKFWEDINSIFPVNSDKNEKGIRVIILSSLVGGTGSGIYLQVAMYLREMLQKKYDYSNVLIRGAFLLPDILVRSNTVDRQEWETVQANGYASLKELNAITLSALGKWDHNEGVAIDLEYRPDQVDIQGRITHEITKKQLPYNFCFLYDYENTKGQHLNNISDYLEQVSDSIYLQLFSPISGRHFSMEDNQLYKLDESKGLGMYCSSGVSTLVYPYESIVEYCSLKWSLQGLNDSWLYLDRLYEEDKKRYEQELRRGYESDKPDRGERYVKYLNSLVTDDRPNIFFKQVFKQTKEQIGRDEEVDKSLLFLQAVEERVEEEIANDSDLKSYEANCKLNEGRFSKKEYMKSEINTVENGLKYYEEQIKKKVNENKNFLTHQIIEQDHTEPGGAGGQNYRLNTWLLKKPEPLHPVAVRYVLYQIQSELNKRIVNLKKDNKHKREAIEKYAKAYHRSGRDLTQTALDRLNDLEESSIFTKSRNFNKFRNEYIWKSRKQLNLLNQYKKNHLLELVFTSVEEEIKQFIKDWERLFENLKDTRNKLTNELEQRAVKYEENYNPTKSYVLATKEHQEKMWENIQNTLDNTGLPSEISEQIYLAHYRQHCDRKSGYITDEDEFKVEDMYREHVLGHCRHVLKTKHQEKLDLNIISALQMEARLLKVDRERHVSQRLEQLDNLAKPFIPFTNQRRELLFWGLHNESYPLISEETKTKRFNEKAFKDDAFSRYELICYRAHYGLELKDLKKFSDGKNEIAGSYYEAYQKRIKKLNLGESSITPHLDKSWHLPIYMPDINPQQTDNDNQLKDKALLLGLIYGKIEIVTEDGQNVYQFFGKISNRLILKQGERVTHETHKLHEALGFNPMICEEILQISSQQQNIDSSNFENIYEHKFIQGCLKVNLKNKAATKNILDVVLGYELENRNNPNLKDRGERLRNGLFELIVQYFNTVYGDHQNNTSSIEASKFIEELWQDSSIRKRERENQDKRYFKEWEALKNSYTNGAKTSTIKG